MHFFITNFKFVLLLNTWFFFINILETKSLAEKFDTLTLKYNWAYLQLN